MHQVYLLRNILNNPLAMNMFQSFILCLLACLSHSQITTVSQSGCSYTFLVAKQEDNSCPVGSVTTAPNNEEIESLKSMVSLLTKNVLQQQEEIENLKKLIEGGSTGNNNGDVRLGTNYVRWGRTSCPDTAELIYEGYTAKSHYTHAGGGANYICLDKNPKWPDVVTGGFQSSGHIYGVEYETLTGLDGSLFNNDAPCAVCHVKGRGEQLMIPGNRTCPQNWTKEYEGLLVSQQYNQQKAVYVCLDGDPDVIPGGVSSDNGGLFYTVEAVCGALPCLPYVNGYEIACVVCTY